jgi:hypothetical protein
MALDDEDQETAMNQPLSLSIGKYHFCQQGNVH